MNKKTTMLMAAACVALTSQAGVLTADQAWQRAASNTQTRMPAAAGTAAPRLLFTSMADNEPAAYVFATASGKGYVLVSADDAAAPVLGYSLEGRFDAEAMPENLRSWLDYYASEIAYARRAGMPAYAAPSRASRENIAPLCATKWDQGAPYNNDCPVSNGQRTVTGCVATALAQIMKYFNYPERPQGMINYTTSTLKYTISVDLNAVKYDWENMLDYYPYGSYGTPEQRAAVAQLMYTVGASVRMDFTTDMSAASTQSVPTALVNNFGYDKSVHICYRDLYQKAEWEDMIYNNLRDCGPVLYRGNDATNMGHAFVCDGYADGYYHFNWGWSGNSDGYYLLSALDPMSQGIGGGTLGAVGFVYGQAAVLDICKPKENSKYFYQIYLNSSYTLPTGSSSLGSTITVKCDYYNGSNTTITSGTLGLEFTDASGNTTYAYGTKITNLASNFGYSNYNVNLPAKLEAGKYKVRPAWMNSDYVRRPIYIKYDQVQTYTAEVSGNKVTFTADAIDTPSIKVDKVTAPAEVFANRYVTLALTLSNTSNVEYFNTVRGGLFATDAKEGDSPKYTGKEMMVDVGVGETCTVDYHTNFGSAPAGTYKFVVYDPRTRKWLGEGVTLTLAEAPKTVITVGELRQSDGSDTAVKNGEVTLEFDVTCESGEFEGYLYIALTRNKESYWRKTFITPYLSVPAGATEHCVVTIVLPSTLSVGNTAKFEVVTDSKKSAATVLSEPCVLTVVDPSGITDVEAGAEVVSVRMYNLHGVEVPADTAAPGHYIVVTLHADGTTTATHLLK